MTEKLRLIPLGGLGEIGKNMMMLQYGNDIIIIDAGVMFPENDMLGIDLVIPDFRYLRDKAHLVRGIILTHGHEDHIGALPYVLSELPAPIYATRLTCGLIEGRLTRRGYEEKVALHTVRPQQRVKLGPFEIEFFAVAHSIPDGVGLAIRTPVGLVVHSGDYKFDYTPVDGRVTDVARLAALGGEGVLVLLADSTNSERPGKTPSEQVVSQALDDLFRQASGRIIIATFASLVSRMQQVIDVAVAHGRRVAITGRSMVENARIAQELGYLRVPPGVLVDLSHTAYLPPHEVVILTTGSQGEPSAALARMAAGNHPQIEVGRGDTVVLSAHAIPGNEEVVFRIINKLFQRGANVIYEQIAPVHVSGHASQDEQRLLLSLVRPRYLVPIHGELRHLHRHAALAREMGWPPEHILVVENGYILEFDGQTAHIGERVPGGYVFVDGASVGDIGPAVLREREILAQDGVVVVTVTRDAASGHLLKPPVIVSRGFVYEPDAGPLLTEAEQLVARLALSARRADHNGVEDLIQQKLAEFLYSETKRRPMILPVVQDIRYGSG